MSKVELLCPAGNFASFEAALYNGADAIFLAGQQYGARAQAGNFTMEEIKRAVQLAHLYGVKIHVTLNTLIHDDEMEDCRAYLSELESIGVDAIIVQDLGIMEMIRHEFSNLQIHASTQMHVHSLNGVRQCVGWGLDRCVVARESSLNLVKEMCKEEIEIETFVQGAYCVSYSGECHFSRNNGGRSANKGECAQSCRLPYELIRIVQGKEEKVDTTGKYLLSLKDLSAIELISTLIDSGVASFKIEGRMKRPEYVACMCRVYRQAIDAYEQGRKFDLSQALQEEMKKVFNRGFTTGYFEHKKGLELMSPIRPNHQGVRIGKIIGFHKDKMQVRLTGKLNQHDGIRILNEKEDVGFVVNYLYKNGQLVSSAENEVVELTKMKVKVGDIVMKTSDSQQLNELSKLPARKVKVKMKVQAYLNQPFLLEMGDGVNTVMVESETVVEEARTVALENERIEKQLCKLGNTPFVCEKIDISLDDHISFPISMLNECRRIACEKLIQKRQKVKLNKKDKQEYKTHEVKITHQLSVNVKNEEQARIALKYPIDLYVESRSLYEKLKREYTNVYFNYPRVYHGKYDREGYVHEIGGMRGNHASPYMNCTNAYAAHVLFENGMKSVCLSYECSDEMKERLVSSYRELFHQDGNFEVEVYGQVENMVLENCLIASQLKLKKYCQECHRKEYYLQDMKHQRYRLEGDDECRLKVYHASCFDETSKLVKFKEMGITNFRVSFHFEGEEEVENIINLVLNRM